MTADKAITDLDIISDLIQKNDRSKMAMDINYYNSCNEAIQKKETNEFSQTFKISSDFYRDIVDQTADYVTGKKITIEGIEDKIIDPNKFINELATNASKKGIEWLYLFINDRGELDYKIIDSFEVIPIWDTEYQDTLVQLIRYYKVEVVTNSGYSIRTRVESWDKDKVTYYIEDVDGVLVKDFIFTDQYIKYHINLDTYVLEKMVAREEKGWGVIPFIPLKLNSEMKSQLTVSLKSLIDAYDLLFSAFADTIEAVQDALLLVKDRSAETYEDLLFKIKRFKILKVDDTGDAKFLSIDFPYSAREKALTMIRENIYSFSKSVDLELMSRGGGQLTTAYIETLFFKLDEKGNKFIKQIDKFLIDFFSFVNIYKTQIKSMQPDDLTKVKFLYDKTRPSNMAEAVSTVNSCKGIISDRTLLSQHPLVTDVDEEIALIEADEQQYLENTTGSGLDATNGDTGDI